jgi:hypothetical protein
MITSQPSKANVTNDFTSFIKSVVRIMAFQTLKSCLLHNGGDGEMSQEEGSLLKGFIWALFLSIPLWISIIGWVQWLL